MDNLRVLLVEDHDPSRLLLFNYLQKSRHLLVWACKNTLDAHTWMTQNGTPDLVILDWNLPLLHGADFIDRLRGSGLYSQVPVLLISGDQPDNNMLAHLDHPLTEFLQKPYDLDQLDASIQHLTAVAA
jgi:DNA-binding response OmpR family regulator